MMAHVMEGRGRVATCNFVVVYHAGHICLQSASHRQLRSDPRWRRGFTAPDEAIPYTPPIFPSICPDIAQSHPFILENQGNDPQPSHKSWP